MPAKSVTISGYFGFGNLGDECILSQEIRWILEIVPDAEITVFSFDPARTSKEHGVYAVNMDDYNQISYALRESDAHVFGGGGIFHEWWGTGNNALLFSGALRFRNFNVPYYATCPIMAKSFGIPLLFFAQGVGPIRSTEGANLVNLTASLADFVSVRDDVSEEVLKKCGYRGDVTVAPDPVFAVEIPERAANIDGLEAIASKKDDIKNCKTVAVILRDWHDSRLLSNIFSEALREIASQETRCVPVLFSFHPSFDCDFYEDLTRRIEDIPIIAKYIGETSLEEKLSAVLAADYVIAMRYHALIFAALKGIPVLPVTYDPKMESLCRMLKIDHLQLKVEEVTPEKFREAFEKVKREARATWQTMKERALTERRKSLKHKELLKEFLLRSKKNEAAYANFSKRYPAPVSDSGPADEKLLKRIDELKSELSYYRQSRAWRWIKRIVGVRDRIIGFQRKIKSEISTLKDKARARRILSEIGSLGYWMIFSPFSQWSSKLFQRPHQLALAAAEKGVGVIFLEPGAEGEAARPLRKIRENLLVVKCIFAEAVRLAASRYEGKIILQIHLPETFEYLQRVTWDYLLYGYIDEVEVFPDYSQKTEKYHGDLLRRADLVVASASALYEKAKSVNPNTILCPNGVDYGFFARAKSIKKEFEGITIGYYGALGRWFDYELWEYAASRRPDWRFVLVGPEYFDGALAKSGILKKSANIEYWGAKDYKELPRILAQFDVATIPFKIDTITLAASPIKLFEYMAGGKPIVSTAMPECMKYKSVLVARSKDEFVKKLEEALKLGLSPDYQQLLDKEARENTWDKRVDQILEGLGIINAIKKERAE